MRTLYLIRHAMPDLPLGERWCVGGRSDLPLGPLGRMQAALLPFRPELRQLGLTDCFDQIFLSSDFGCRKPSPAFFRAAMEKAQVTADELLMVGNDPTADIRGADGCGIESRYFHTHQSPPRSGPLPEGCREITRLTDLL